MPIKHRPERPNSFGLIYIGQACRHERHDDCLAWWHARQPGLGTRCACPCHNPTD